VSVVFNDKGRGCVPYRSNAPSGLPKPSVSCLMETDLRLQSM
jgi:hypothetical protein